MWTSERVQELRTKIAAGMTRGAIAQEWGVTRNTIIGKCTRLGLITENSRNMGGFVVILKRKERKKKKEKFFKFGGSLKAKKPPLKIELPKIAGEPEPLLVSLLDLNEFQCRWVCEGTDDHCLPLYCGHPARDGRWCDYHASRVWGRR